MKEYDALEAAYKNGFEADFELINSILERS